MMKKTPGIPRTHTYNARYGGNASNGSCFSRSMQGSRESARSVGCYRLAVNCPIRHRTRPCGPDCAEPCSGMPNPPCPDRKTCEDLLESVAEAQMALSHILNAEGEKLSGIIAFTDDVGALLKANWSVNRTLNDVICKEQALYSELERILEICGACAPESKDARASGRPDRTFPGSVY